MLGDEGVEETWYIHFLWAGPSDPLPTLDVVKYAAA